MYPLRTVAHIFLGLAEGRLRGNGDADTRPILNVRNLQDGHLPPADALTKRSVPADADVTRYTVRRNDVVITCRGTQLKVASIGLATEGVLISSNLIAIRAGVDLLPAVLLAFLLSPDGQKALLKRGRSSTSSISLTPGAVGELSLPLPPIEIQRRIAELVTAGEDNYTAALRAATQRRAIAHAVAVSLLQGRSRLGERERT